MTKSKARAVADVSEGVILARVEICAPIERVFRAISSEELANWWGDAALYRTTKHTVELRVGGAYRSEGEGANGPFHVAGTILAVDPPRRLEQTWEPSWEQGPPTKVTWMLEAIPTGTRITLRHSGFTDAGTCEDHADGWERVLGWLNRHVVTAPAWFFSRLIPPRPTFMWDHTPAEAVVMGQHARFLRGLITEGNVLAAGPVGGEGNGFGICLAQAASAAEHVAMFANDPAIVSGLGFRYEHAPMASILV